MRAIRKRTITLALGSLALLNGLVYAAYTLPRSLEERAVARTAESLKHELGEEKRLLEALRGKQEAIEANTRDTRTFYKDHVAARKSSLVPILRHIETLAEEQGLRVGSQGFEADPVKGTPLERFKITMPVNGTYRQLVSLVGRLEASSYFLTLDEVRVRGTGDEGRVQLDLVLSCYFAKGAPSRDGT